MAEPESSEQLPGVDALQFRRAEPIREEPLGIKSCAACKLPVTGEYFQVQNQVICSSCASKIRAGQQSQRPVPLARAVIYGVGAAIAGCILYAIVLAMGVQIGIVALLVGWMVGKAIRTGSYGIGGRRQQILAVALTYFAISTSFFPAAVFYRATHAPKKPPSMVQDQVKTVAPAISPAKAISRLLLFAVVSPFLELRSSPAGGLISLFILFIGLQRAWALTARHEIIVTGPYS